MGDTGSTVTVEQDGWTVESNSAASEEQLSEAVSTPEKEEKKDEKPDLSKAASDLGKKGGEASAEKRKAEKSIEKESTEDKPEKPAVEAKPEKKPKEEKPEEKTEAKPEETEDEKKSREVHERNKRDARERVLRATQKEAEAKRELAAERAQRTALEARLDALERQVSPKPQTPAQTDGAPRMEDYGEDAESYLNARDEWNFKRWSKQIGQEYQQRFHMEAQDAALSRQINTFRESVKDVVDRCSDEVLSLRTEFQLDEGERPTGENWLANEFVSSPETAPSLMLYLSEHPDELQRIAALSNWRAVSRAVAKLEAQLSAATTGSQDISSDQSEVSTAPPPIKPVKGTPSIADSDEYREGMSLDEYAKVWNRLKKAGRR